MIASADIFQLAPDFENAVVNVHNTTMPIALVVCFAGLTFQAVRANHERSLTSIWPELLRILLVSMFLVNMPTIGNWVGGLVTDIEQASGVNGNPLSAFVAAIRQKFGVDLSSLLAPVSPGGSLGSSSSGTLGAIVSTYGYEQAGDATYDPKSAQGIGAFPQFSAPGSLGSVPVALAISPSLSGGLTPGQQVTVNLANGQSITGIYADKTADSFNGQTLNRVDIYDPNQQYSSLSGVGITSINGVAPQNNGNPVSNFFNGLLHPAETAEIAMFGMFTLALSYIAAFIMWLVAVLQSILYYSEIAVAPIFVGFLLVRGLENIAKAFLLSFFAISLWPIAFLVSGLITQLLVGLAVNSGNVGAAGAANASGMTLLWMVGTSIWVIASSILGPWFVSKRFVAGASGMVDMVVGARSAAGKVYLIGSNVAGGISGGVGLNGSGFISAQRTSRINGPHQNFARRPMATGGKNSK
jgi:hypothetical protein